MSGQATPTLTTERLLLVPLSLSDAPDTRAAERWLVTATGWAALRGAEPHA